MIAILFVCFIFCLLSHSYLSALSPFLHRICTRRPATPMHMTLSWPFQMAIIRVLGREGCVCRVDKSNASPLPVPSYEVLVSSCSTKPQGSGVNMKRKPRERSLKDILINFQHLTLFPSICLCQRVGCGERGSSAGRIRPIDCNRKSHSTSGGPPPEHCTTCRSDRRCRRRSNSRAGYA